MSLKFAKHGDGRGRVRGTSLVELMISSMLVGLLMLEVWALVQAGGTFYLKAKGQGDIQRNSLLALRWISKDISEGSAISFRQYSQPDSTRTGIVFGSPKTMSGNVEYDDVGHIKWSTVIGYYIEVNDGGLYRQQIELEEQQGFPPIIDDDAHAVDVLAALPRPRLVARSIRNIETVQGPNNIRIELSTRDEQMGFGIKVQTRLEMKN